MNVPSQYKGFSKLPEDVQRKMDPDLAQKYMGGGSVMARPLFRQAGGPVAAQMPMPQQQMPMDPALMDQAAMIQNTVADQANTMTAEYIQNQLAQLDSAETSEQAINAIRGNEKSIEERYRELADLVGEEDAGQTPQSVLTLVQPVMLMTEQGAMDSGLGQLMQGLIGEVDMMTEGGEPTDMGQGIGSLMMAGAAEEPMGVGQQPVANFSQGGAVQRFQEGGEASRLQQIYSEMLPVYQSILGDLDERRRLTQSQILFDIADRAGAFAAGIDPRTGQRISGSPAAQLAGAMSGLGGQIGERLGALEEADQRLRLAALQGAQSEYSAERAAARAAAGRERGIGNAYEAVDAQGNVIATEFLANRDDLDAFRAAYPDATIRVQQGAATLGDLYEVVIDGQVVTTVPLGTTADYNRILEQYPGATIREASDFVAPRFEPTNLFNRLTGEVVTVNTGMAPGVQQATEMVDSGEFTTQAPEGLQLLTMYGPNGEERIFNQNSPAGQQSIMELANTGDWSLNPPESEPLIKGIPREMFDTFTPEEQARILGTAPDTPGAVNSIPRDIFDRLPEEDQRRILGLVQEPQEMVAYVNPEDSSDRVNAVPGSPEAIAAQNRGLVRTSEATAIAGLTPEVDPLTNVDLMERYGRGETTDTETAIIEDEIASTMQTPAFNPATQQFEAPAITNLVMNASRSRAALGLPTQLEVAERVPGEPTLITRERQEELVQAGRDAFGTLAAGIDAANATLSLFQMTPGPQTEQAVNRITALNTETLIAYRALTEGKIAQAAVEDFQETQPTPAQIRTTPFRAKQQINGMIRFYEGAILDAQNTLDSGVVSAAEQQRLNTLINTAQRQIAEYRAVIQGINVALGTDIDLNQFVVD